jgi:RHS repeat-associated protein
MTGISYNDGSTPSVGLSYDQSSLYGVTLNNSLGRLTNAAAANSMADTIFSYDPMGRVAEDWQCTPLNCGAGFFSLNFGYDYLGDVTSLANNMEGVTYTYTYDTLARLTKLQSSLSDSNHPGTLLTVNTYNPLGEVTKATLGNGIVRTIAYDSRGRLTSLTDGAIYSFTLGYAGDSNILTGNDSINGNWTYTYDDFNRIASANNNSAQQTYSYAYDRYGNRWHQNSNPSYVFNNNNQIQGSGIVYDAAGNITNDGLGNTYTYDAENRVIAVSGNNSATYVYNAFGQRVRSTINSTPYDFIYNNRAAVDEVTSSGWQWGDAGAAGVALYASSTTYFNHTDWLGSIRAWSNPSGSSVGTCASLPFGDGQNCTGTSPNSWDYTGFTGLPYDSESGMTHALFRQLSTTQGRWTTPDPSGLTAVDPTNPQTWNRYVYVANNPLKFVDRHGLQLGNTCPADPTGEDGGGCGAGSGGGGGGGGDSADCPAEFSDCGGYYMEGIQMPASTVQMLLSLGWALQCPSGDCWTYRNGQYWYFAGSINGAYFPVEGPGWQFSNLQDALADGAQWAAAETADNGVENCGFVIGTEGGPYTFTSTMEGSLTGCDLRQASVPSDETPLYGDYHSHVGGIPNSAPERFSGQPGDCGGLPYCLDVEWAVGTGVPLSLGTPGGRIIIYYPLGSCQVFVVGSPAGTGTNIPICGD